MVCGATGSGKTRLLAALARQGAQVLDLEALAECARLAERIVGHPLPGKVKTGGSLKAMRRTLSAS